jgi:transcriptional regulator with XRE-family HTH domain
MPTERMESVGTLDQMVGRNVRSFRERLSPKRSQQWLGSAEGVGVFLGYTWPKQVVSRIENGERSLDARELVAVALLLDVSVIDLLTAHDQLDDRHEVELSAERGSPWAITVEELRATVMGQERARALGETRRALFARIASEAAYLASAPSVELEAFDPAYYGSLPYDASTVVAPQPKRRRKKR